MPVAFAGRSDKQFGREHRDCAGNSGIAPLDHCAYQANGIQFCETTGNEARDLYTEDYLTIGVLLAACLAVAALMDWVRVPKVTAYLLVGVAVGHHGLNLVSPTAMHHLEPFADMAMALVLFNLGSQFPLSKLARLRRLVPLSIGEQVATFAVVTIGVYLFSSNIGLAVLLGTLALATAPATTVLVLKEISNAAR